MKSVVDYSKINEAVGKKFGRLTVIKILESINGHKRVECLCDCGNKTVTTYRSLVTDWCKSCGCLLKEANSKRLKTHGGTGTKLYDNWGLMKARCDNPKNKSYPDYGGRGISVCEEWANDFSVFRTWALSNSYSPELSIERIDNNGNYEPGNCKWGTRKEQNNNTRRNRFITYNGETLTTTLMSEKYGIPYKAVWARLSMGWDIERVFTAPLRKTKRIK